MAFGGIGPIPWSSVIACADRLGMGIDESERLVSIIRIVDTDYIKMLTPKKNDRGKYRSQAKMSDPKAVGRLLDGFERRRQAREQRKQK